MQLDRITDRAALDRHLAGLADRDERLAPVLDAVDEVPLRLRPGGFAGMAAIVISQLLSVASAQAIQGRFETLLGEVGACRYLELDETEIRACGLSGSKFLTLRGLAEAELAGRLDYERLAMLPADAALAALMAHKGVGLWSAEIYLLFCTGHPDIFPAGDLALRKVVGEVVGTRALPTEKRVRSAARKWAPHRGAAARLLWRYFAVSKQKEGIGV